QNYAALPLGAVHSGLQFGEAMLSCKMRDGEYYFTAEGECGWLTMVATTSEHDANGSANGYEREASTVGGGVQWALNDRWHVGLAAAFERDTIDANTLENFRAQVAEGRTMHVGAVLKGNFSGTTIAASLSGARGEYDARRRAFLTFAARSAPTVYQEALQLRVAHAFDSPRWYWRPMLDLGITRVRLGSFLENGAGATNLAVDSGSETFVNLRPGVELGYQLAVGDAIARLYARLAVDRFVSGGDFSVDAVFQEAPGAAGPFRVTESLDRTVRECAFGVDLFGTRGLTLRLGYAGQFSANGTSHGGTIKFVRAF
ncbi:MAG: autotransporter outer membrane beta-barrel domain-containing protein, partial [Steroidobacteraceae bacterium]